MNKRSHIRAVILIAPVSALKSAGKPNILFVLADDPGYGDVGRYEWKTACPFEQTPALQGALLQRRHRARRQELPRQNFGEGICQACRERFGPKRKDGRGRCAA